MSDLNEAAGCYKCDCGYDSSGSYEDEYNDFIESEIEPYVYFISKLDQTTFNSALLNINCNKLIKSYYKRLKEIFDEYKIYKYMYINNEETFNNEQKEGLKKLYEDFIKKVYKCYILYNSMCIFVYNELKTDLRYRNDLFKLNKVDLNGKPNVAESQYKDESEFAFSPFKCRCLCHGTGIHPGLIKKDDYIEINKNDNEENIENKLENKILSVEEEGEFNRSNNLTYKTIDGL